MDFYEEEPTQVELNPNPALRTANMAKRFLQRKKFARTRLIQAVGMGGLYKRQQPTRKMPTPTL